MVCIMVSIAETYESWKQCLSRNLGSELKKSYVQERVRVFSDSAHLETKKFAQVYGQQRAAQVLQWFQTLSQEM